MSRVAIIPARGGSKRLPRKNILPIEGLPMLTYPIKSAINSDLFDHVIVSTEDTEIAEVARDSGAGVIVRPKEYAGDKATVVQVCQHVLNHLEEQSQFVSEFCCIYATAIFISAEDLKRSNELLHRHPEADFVMGVSGYHLEPVRALKKSDGYLEPMWPEYIEAQANSKSWPRLVASNGTLYWARTEAFRESDSFYGQRLKAYEIPRSRLVDINTLEDLKLAREMASRIFVKDR